MTLKSVVSILQPTMIPLHRFEDIACDLKAFNALAKAHPVTALKGG